MVIRPDRPVQCNFSAVVPPEVVTSTDIALNSCDPEQGRSHATGRSVQTELHGCGHCRRRQDDDIKAKAHSPRDELRSKLPGVRRVSAIHLEHDGMQPLAGEAGPQSDDVVLAASAPSPACPLRRRGRARAQDAKQAQPQGGCASSVEIKIPEASLGCS